MANLKEEQKFVEKLLNEEYDSVEESEQLNDAHDLLYRVYSTSENARIVKAVKAALVELARAIEITREPEEELGPTATLTPVEEKPAGVHLKQVDKNRFVRV